MLYEELIEDIKTWILNLIRSKDEGKGVSWNDIILPALEEKGAPGIGSEVIADMIKEGRLYEPNMGCIGVVY